VGHKTSLIPPLFIEVHVTSQDSERSCIGVSICLCFCDFFGMVSTMVIFCFSHYYQYNITNFYLFISKSATIVSYFYN